MRRLGCVTVMWSFVVVSIFVAGVARAESHPATVLTKTVFVQANNAEYMDTGITLKGTDRLVIMARGRVKTKKRGGLTDAWGTGRLASNKLWDARPGALAARVGQRSFGVGGLFHGGGVVGKLELRVHDKKHSDNSGSYIVYVTVISRTDGKSGDFIGVPKCDEYVDRYARCVKDRIPQAQQAVMARSLKTMREAWRKAAVTERGRASLSMACKVALETAVKSMAAFKCDWGIQ